MMNKKLIVLGIIVLILLFTGFLAFEKYYGSLKSEVPGKWDLSSGEGCFTEVRFFGSGDTRTIKMYEGPEDDRTAYNGKYTLDGDEAHVELIKGEEIVSFDMMIDQIDEKNLHLTYDIDGEAYDCAYIHGVVEK